MNSFLWDVLCLAEASEWSDRRLDNLPAWETLELARWFLRGQAVGQKPLFDGLCGMCGALLHGDIGAGSLSNKSAGPPCNRDGAPVVLADGGPDVAAQPPISC